VDSNSRAVFVQACHNSRANSSGSTGDENDFVVECLFWHGIIHKDFIVHMQYEPTASLPKPDELSSEHSDRVRAHILKKIEESGGQLSFAEYMHEALYAPGLGYYSAGSAKFGAEGDFVTAPEISSVFGRVLARQCAEVLATIENGEVLEFGAGSGKLAVDLLGTLEALHATPAAYHILEVSPDLADRQKKRLRDELPHLVDRVHWLSDLPTDFEGVIVANEVLDALPVERFVRRASAVFQQCVSTEGNQFVWTERDAPEHLATAVAEIEADTGREFSNGYTSEVSIATPLWISDLAGCLRRGATFLFDYGVSRREYYAPDRAQGWLRCHFRHHAHDNPLIYPGIQDLTSWIDYSLLAGAAKDAGLDILGYQTQSQFLMGGGLEIEMRGFADLPVAKQLELSGQIKTLTLPGEMGENFKCIALGRGDIVTPTAFHFADRTQTL
jgi:SAM-dependent MidA family methyltransferase